MRVHYTYVKGGRCPRAHARALIYVRAAQTPQKKDEWKNHFYEMKGDVGVGGVGCAACNAQDSRVELYY